MRTFFFKTDTGAKGVIRFRGDLAAATNHFLGMLNYDKSGNCNGKIVIVKQYARGRGWPFTNGLDGMGRGAIRRLEFGA